MSDLQEHVRFVAQRLRAGRVVPLLGAGANLCDRAGGRWREGVGLPSGFELARLLAREFDVPEHAAGDLARASEWIRLKHDDGPLYERLHSLFDADYQPTTLHRFLADLPERAPNDDGSPRPLLLVTTNYDDLLERAFDVAGQPYDVLVYMALGPRRGRLVHQRRDGDGREVDRPNEYAGISLATRSVILKLHGNVDRNGSDDSYVITEDDYLDYLTNAADLNALVPPQVLLQLKRCHFLFLGYGLRDWNLRVMLHRLWSERQLGYRSWAVQLDPLELDEMLWEHHKVDVHAVALDDYVANLSAELTPGVSAGRTP
jgi:hypothetical protein